MEFSSVLVIKLLHALLQKITAQVGFEALQIQHTLVLPGSYAFNGRFLVSALNISDFSASMLDCRWLSPEQ
jgi:hypothetical protein